MKKQFKYIVFYDDVDILKTEFTGGFSDDITFDKFSDAKDALISYRKNALIDAQTDLKAARAIKKSNLRSE